jgi:hypothetical protein
MIRNTAKYKIYAYILIWSGITIIFFSLYLFLTKTTDIITDTQLNTNLLEQFGGFIGGFAGVLFSLAGIFLIIQTIKDQEIAFSQQQIESRFFELLRIHRENCNEINIQEVKGREVFRWLLKEFYKNYEIVSEINNRTGNKNNEANMINIAYLCFYFGAIGKHTSIQIRNYLKTVDSYFINELMAEFEKYSMASDRTDNFPYPPFNGHQLQLAHYYRHLIQMIKYINEQPVRLLSYKEKYQYIKTLRAQFTIQEQVLIFFNSLSDVGTAWEKRETFVENNRLITKYNLIKNIPPEYISFVDMKTYYPDVEFFGGNEIAGNRKKLIKIYNRQ